MFFALVVAVSLFLSAVVFVVFSFIAKCNALAELKKLPGPKASALFGNALQMQGEVHDVFKRVNGWMEDLYQKGIICIWIGPVSPLVMIFKAELAEVLLNSRKHMTKSSDYELLHPWLGTGLLTRILNDFIQVIEEQAAILVTQLKEKANGGVFNIMPYIARCTLDVICVTSMGSSPNAQEKSSSPYVKAVVRMSELLEIRYRSPWLWSDTLFSLTSPGREMNKCLEIVHGFTNKVIDDRIDEREATKTSKEEQKNEEDECEFRRKKRLAFLDLLLEAYNNGEISREGVREEVDTFAFEGHDTTAAGITWTLYLLGRHPNIQQRVYEEVQTFFDGCPETLTVEDLKEFRYLECVLKEAQRIFPPVPFYSRTTTEDCLLGGYITPKGTTVGISSFQLHRNPEVWPAPLEFNPDRFLPENSQGRHTYAFLPFSAGPRNCIGQRLALLEEKLVVAYVLRHFCINSTQTYGDLCLCSQMILRPKEGIFVTLTKRK
ncbi:cytochrome P450 4c3-like isoform X2 [Oculina patagonica]